MSEVETPTAEALAEEVSRLKQLNADYQERIRVALSDVAKFRVRLETLNDCFQAVVEALRDK